MKKIFFPAFFSLTAVLLLSFPSYSKALTVGPAKMEFSLDPGTETIGNIFLMNEGGEARTLYPSFEKFIEVNGAKQFLPGEYTDLGSWLDMPKSVSFEPGQSKDIPFTLKIPADAPPGGHFVVIWWSTAPPNAKSGGGTSIVTRAGILVYLNVSGEIKETASIENFSPENKANFFSWLPESFDVMFKNTGNVYLKPLGEIRVKNLLGITDAIYSVNSYGAEILPQSGKSLRVLPKTMRWGGFGFGFYRATMVLNYGEDENRDKQITAETSFFVITWQIIVPVILLILLTFWLSTRGVKKYNRWVIEKYTRRQ